MYVCTPTSESWDCECTLTTNYWWQSSLPTFAIEVRIMVSPAKLEISEVPMANWFFRDQTLGCVIGYDNAMGHLLYCCLKCTFASTMHIDCLQATLYTQDLVLNLFANGVNWVGSNGPSNAYQGANNKHCWSVSEMQVHTADLGQKNALKTRLKKVVLKPLLMGLLLGRYQILHHVVFSST